MPLPVLSVCSCKNLLKLLSVLAFHNTASLNTKHILPRLRSWAQWPKAAPYQWPDCSNNPDFNLYLEQVESLPPLRSNSTSAACLYSVHYGHRKDSLWTTNIFSNERHSKSKRLPNFIKQSQMMKQACSRAYILLFFPEICVIFSLHCPEKWGLLLGHVKTDSQKALNKSFCLTAFLKARKTLSFTALGRLKCIIKEQTLKYLDNSAKRTWYDIRRIVSVWCHQ